MSQVRVLFLFKQLLVLFDFFLHFLNYMSQILFDGLGLIDTAHSGHGLPEVIGSPPHTGEAENYQQ